MDAPITPITLADMRAYQDSKEIRRDCRFYGAPRASVIDLGRIRARKKLRELEGEEPIPHNRPQFTQSMRAELFLSRRALAVKEGDYQ